STTDSALSNGALLSNASPVKETNTVGMQSAVPKMNAGDVGSEAVYPLASKVFGIPPFGNDDASGSCWTIWLPVNFSSGSLPSNEVSKKASCFSAVVPVKG